MSLRTLIKPTKLIYKGKSQLGPDSYVFDFVSTTEIVWNAGQYASFEIPMPTGRSRRKTFNIVSAPAEGVVSIATRIIENRPDMYKKALLRLKKGAPVKMRGPKGPLNIKDNTKRYAFLASGIGITPFRSILKQLSLEGAADIEATLFYVGNKESHYFKDDFSEIKSVLKNLNLYYIYKPDRITGHLIEDSLGKELFNTVFLLSGSPNMVNSYRRTLQGLKIKRKNIIRNPFLKKSAQIPKVVLPKKPNIYTDL